MMPERAVSRIMRLGISAGLIFMFLGVVLSFTGHYSEEVRLSADNIFNGSLFTDGAGLMYLGTLFIILTPVSVLLFLIGFHTFVREKKYAVYCLLIIAVLIFVVITRY